MLHGKLEVTTLGSELRVRTNALFKAFFLDLLLFFFGFFFHFGWEIKKKITNSLSTVYCSDCNHTVSLFQRKDILSLTCLLCVFSYGC